MTLGEVMMNHYWHVKPFFICFVIRHLLLTASSDWWCNVVNPVWIFDNKHLASVILTIQLVNLLSRVWISTGNSIHGQRITSRTRQTAHALLVKMMAAVTKISRHAKGTKITSNQQYNKRWHRCCCVYEWQERKKKLFVMMTPASTPTAG